jgi:cathepsin L
MQLAFLYIKSNGGVDTEPTYPYEAKRHKCRFDPKNIGATDTVICFLQY